MGVRIAAFAAVMLLTGCSSLLTHTDSPSSTAPVAALNAPVRDGKFEFVVTDVTVPNAEPTGGAHWYGPQPRGQWVIVTMTVRNVGAESQTFFLNNQKLIDSAGRKFD